MARETKLQVAAINIAAHPHDDPDVYVNLFDDAMALTKDLPSRGDQRLLLQRTAKIKEDGRVRYIDGTIARFTHIDMNQPWFNFNTFDQAEDNEVEEVNIPPELRPNYKGFAYRFFPNKHLLVFENKYRKGSISPGIVASFFEQLFNSEELKDKYEQVNVNVINDEEVLDEIFNISMLSTLEIEITRPNPDELGGLDEDIQQRLTSQHMNKVRVNYASIPGQSIEPDDKTKKVAEVAVNNGYVSGAGKDERGIRVEKSTKDHPKTESMKFDPDLMTFSSAFNTLAESYVR